MAGSDLEQGLILVVSGASRCLKKYWVQFTAVGYGLAGRVLGDCGGTYLVSLVLEGLWESRQSCCSISC